MPGIASHLDDIRARMGGACERSGRDPGSACLIAVSKTFPVAAVREAVAAGQVVFGESRLQEAEPKIREVSANLEWHFIGRVQRNKVRKILPLFSHIHAVDSRRLAEFMDGVAAELGLKPAVFLQVDLACEESKGGFHPSELAADIGPIMALPNLRVVGLMAIPPAADEAGASRHWFRMLRALRDELGTVYPGRLPFLSMGMSGDFEVAIEEGATHVRIGSAIFGSRFSKVEGELG